MFERGLAPVIITTGGAGNDPQFSEGQVGRDYLEKRGVPDENLIAETQGGDTDESVQRVAVILRANEMQTCIVVSDAYHVFRAKQMMAAQGIHVYLSPRPGSIPKTTVGRYLARATRESELSAVQGEGEVRQLSAVSSQPSAISSQLSALSSQLSAKS